MKKWIIGILSLIIIAGAGIYFFAPWEVWACQLQGQPQDQPRSLTLGDEFEPDRCWNPYAYRTTKEVTRTLTDPETGEKTGSYTEEVSFIPVPGTERNGSVATYMFNFGTTRELMSWWQEERSLLESSDEGLLELSFKLPWAVPEGTNQQGYPTLPLDHPVQVVPMTRPESAFPDTEEAEYHVQPDNAVLSTNTDAQSVLEQTHPSLSKLLNRCQEHLTFNPEVHTEAADPPCLYELVVTKEAITVNPDPHNPFPATAHDFVSQHASGDYSMQWHSELLGHIDITPGNWLWVFSAGGEGKATAVVFRIVKWNPNIPLIRAHFQAKYSE